MEAARAAFPGWSARSPQERSQVLHRLADLLEQSLEELAQAESKDQGEQSKGQGECGLICGAVSAGTFCVPPSREQSQGVEAAVSY